MKYTLNLHYYIFLLSHQSIFSFLKYKNIAPRARMHCFGGAVQQVTLRQVTPKLVISKLVKEGERLVMKCTFSTIVSCNLSTSIFGIG